MVAPAAPRVRTIRACRCIDQEPRIETIGSHLARRDSRKDRTQASRYAKRSEGNSKKFVAFQICREGTPARRERLFGIGPDKRWPLSDCFLCAARERVKLYRYRRGT